MNRNIKKLLSTLLLIAMLASALPVSTLAEALGAEDVEAAVGSPARYGIMLLSKKDEALTDGALYANDDLYITGKIPGNGIVEATPVTMTAPDGREVIASYDIKIYANANQQRKGKTWKPAGKKVQVHWRADALEKAKDVAVYHYADNAGTPELVAENIEPQDGWVTFDAESFSVYALTGVIEKDIEIGGDTYRVTVTYDSDSGIPEGAELEVSPLEVSDEEAAAMMGYGEDDIVFYSKLLDISIMHEGVEIEPVEGSNVTVSVKLLDAEPGAEIDVVHLVESGAPAGGRKLMKSNTASVNSASSANNYELVPVESSLEGDTVTFTTDSFSLYGFSSRAKALLNWTDDLLSGTILGKTTNEEAKYAPSTVDGITKGLELLDAYTVTKSENLWLSLQRVKDLALGSLETVDLYTIANGQLGELVKEGVTLSDVLRYSLSDMGGFALVKDTGLRERVLNALGVTVDGMVPKAAELNVEPVETALTLDENSEAIASYDITINNADEAWQPGEGEAVQVSLACPEAAQALADGYGVELWHVADDGSATQVKYALDGDSLRFEAESFSEYTVVKTVLEKTVLASDGNTYKITVSYDANSGLPTEEEGAHLSVTEILTEDKLADVTAAIDSERAENRKVALSRTFDIKILDKDENEVQPNEGANVQVTFELVQVGNSNLTTEVYHIKQEGEELTAESLTVTNEEGNTATVDTTGFSYFTVEFTYEGKEYVLPGDDLVRLDEVLTAIGITGEIEDAEVSNNALFEAHHSWDGYWYVYALNPFDTTEWMKVTVDGVVYEIVVTDDLFGVEASGSAAAAKFASGMDIATITIQDLGGLTGTVELASGITKESSGRIYWSGTLAQGGKKTLSGDQVKVKYIDAATTADRALCDVEIVISDVVIYGDKRTGGTGNFVFATLCPTSNGNTYPLAITAYPDGTSNGYREGVQAKITINVYKTGTTTPADGTFAFTIFDLNQNKINTSWQNITDAENHYTFSEYVTVDGSAYDVYYNTARMTETGSDIHPKSGTDGGHSYETGIAFLARSGASLIGYNGGGMGAGATSFYIMPRAGINHPITSYSGDGGSIETTTSGTIGKGTVLPGGTAGDERVYTVPAGKHVEYKMTPDSGYRMKDIEVDGTVVAKIDDSDAAIPTYTNSDTTNCVNNGDGTWTYTFPEVGATHKIVVQWEPEQDLPLSLGHIGMQPGTNGAITHVSLENMVPSGHPTTTTLPKDGTPREMGELTPPPPMTGYTWFTFALGYTDDSGEMKLYAKSDRLAMRFTPNGQLEYSVNYNASSASNTWEVWSFRDSQGSLIIPKVYAVYVQNPSTDRGIVYTTATAIARNTTDDAFVDPQMLITFNEVIERRYYTITVNNPTDANWSYTVTQRSTEPVETLSNSTHTHVPGEAHGHALSFATPQRTIAENDTASFTFDNVYADNMLVTETVPANYTLTNILKLHGVRGTENISEGTYRIYANTVNADAADPTKQFTVTRSVDSETGGYIFQVSAYNKAGDTEVEFINTRNTVNLTIRELLDDARLAANTSHDFKVTLRGRETWTDGRVHYSMLGTFTVTATNGDLTTGGSQTVSVPANADILIIQRFGDTFTSGGVTVKVTEYDTEATSSNATVIDYRPLDKEYMITPGLTADATVTLKNVLKPRLVTVKKVLVGGDLNQSFSFTATLTQRDGTTPIANYLVYTDETGLERTTNASGLVRFTLSGAGTRDLKVPYGARITVRELKAAADTYTTVYSIDNEETPHDGTEAVIGGDTTLGITKNHEVVFTNTSDFSVFDDANTITYEFYLDKEFTQAYKFPLVSSSNIIYTTNRLTVRNGGTLDVPPQPASTSDDLVFQGWFKNTADVGDPENWVQETGFGKIMTVTDAMDGTTVKVYAKFAETVYATFHENKITEAGNTFWPIQQTVPMAKGDTLNLNNYEPVVPDTHREFIGWTDTLNQDGTLGSIITTNYDAYPVNANVHFYPLYNEKKVVSFLTGASGTGATYYAPVGVNMDAEVYSAVQAILDDDKIDNKIPRLAGYTFEGWYLNYDQASDTYSNPVALPTNDSSVYSRGTDAGTSVNQDVTLYAKWTPAPDANFSVVIWTQDISDAVGLPASQKKYNVRSVINKTGTTDTLVEISGTSGLQVTYTGVGGTSVTDTVSDAPGTGFEFVRADTAYIAADGSTTLNVYYDRQVYTLIVRAGERYDAVNDIASEGFTYERTSTPDPNQTHYVGDSKTEVTYRMLGWKESNGTLHPVNGEHDPRVFSAYRTSLLGYYLLSWSLHNNNTVPDGSRGWILDTAGLFTNALIQSSTPVTAVYAWQDASGNVYDPATSEFYARHEAGHRGDVLDTYVGLYQAPLSVNTNKNGTEWLLYYQYNSDEFKYYICTESSQTWVSNLTVTSQISGGPYYETNARQGGPIQYVLDQGRTPSIEGPTSFSFDNMLEITGMKYWEPSVWNGTTGSVTVYNRSGTAGKLKSIKVLSSNTNTIKTNLSSDHRTLTLFLGAKTPTSEINIYSYYYTLPVPQQGDPLVPSYASYVTAYEGDVIAGNATAQLTYFGKYTNNGNTGYFSANRFSTDGLELKAYSSNLYNSGNWNDVVYVSPMVDNRLRFYYESPYHNRIASAEPSISDPAHVRLLYIPEDRTLTFRSFGFTSAPVAGTLALPNAWSLSAFDPTANNPLKTYNDTLNVPKGTTLKDAAQQYTWAQSYLDTVGPNSTEADMTFQGWYYDTAFTQEFHVTDAIEQETTLYAQWDYPWYVVQIDPNGGVLTGGSNNGSTWTWKQPTDTVDPYDSFIKREFVESETGDYYYHINVYDKTNTAYSDDVGGLYDYDLDGAAGINAIARTAIYDTTSPGSDGKRYTYQPGVWKLDSWDYMWYDTANRCWPTEWQHDYVFSTRITNHLRLRAVWKRVATYQIVFDAADGTVVTNTGTSLSGLYNDGDYYVDGAPMTIHVAAEPTDPKRQFVGWKSSVRANSNIYPLGTTYVVSDLDAVGNTITLVAQYSRMDLTSLRYHANGGEGKLTDVTAATGTNQRWDGDSNTLLNIERNSRVNISGGEGFTYRKAGYTLVGWSKDDDASDEAFEETSPGVWAVKASNIGKGYFALGQQNAVIDGATGNELFAVWQPPTNVTFDPNGGSGTLTDLDTIAAGIQDSYVDGNAIMNVAVGSTVPLSSGAGLLDPAGRNSTDPNYRPIIGWNSDQAAADRGVVEYALSAANYTVPAKGTNRLYAVWRPEKAIVNVHFANKDGRGYRDMDSVWQGDLLTIEVTKDYATTAFALSNSLAEDLDNDPTTPHGHNNDTHAQLLSSGIIEYASEIKPGETASDLASASAVTGLYYNPTDGKAYSSYNAGSYSNEVTDVWFVYAPAADSLPVNYVKVNGDAYASIGSGSNQSVGTAVYSASVLGDPVNDSTTYSDYTYAIGVRSGAPASLYGMNDALRLRIVLNAAGTGRLVQFSTDGTNWYDYDNVGSTGIYVVYYPKGSVYVTVVAEVKGGTADPESVLIDPDMEVQFAYTRSDETWNGTASSTRTSRTRTSYIGSNQYSHTFGWSVTDPGDSPNLTTAVENDSFTLKPGQSKVFVLNNTPGSAPVSRTSSDSSSTQLQSTPVTAKSQKLRITQTLLTNYTLAITDDNGSYGTVSGTNSNIWEISSAKSKPMFALYQETTTQTGGYSVTGSQTFNLVFADSAVQDDTTVTFTNTREVVQVNFSKTLTDALATGPKPFGFTIDASQDWTNGNTATLNKLTGNVSVSNGGTGAFTIAIPKGADLTIVETGDTSEYETTATTTAGTFDSATKTVTATGVTADITVAYTNSRKYTLTFAGIWNGMNAYSVTQEHDFGSGVTYTTDPTASFDLLGTVAVPTGYEFLGWATTPAKAAAETPDYDVNSLTDKVFIDNDGSTDDLLPSGATSGDVTLYAVYRKAEVKLTVTKETTGAMGDLTKEFTFTLAGLTAGTQVSWTKQEKTTAGGTYSNLSTGATGTETADSNGSITFELKHWQKIELMVPHSVALTLTEDHGYYTQTISGLTASTTRSVSDVSDGKQFTLAGDDSVNFTNNLDAVSPTGVNLRYAPYMLMLLFGIAILLIRRRRERD